MEPLPSSAAAVAAAARVEIADGDDDPLASERAGERLTDAAGASRDDGDLAAQRAGSLGHGVNYGERSGPAEQCQMRHRNAPLGM